jgi:hypothetical protein
MSSMLIGILSFEYSYGFAQEQLSTLFIPIAIIMSSMLIGILSFEYSYGFAQEQVGSTFTSKGMIDSTTVSNGTEEFLLR